MVIGDYMVRQSIFIVEDEVDMLELIKDNLDKEGYNVSCFSSGEDALKDIYQDKPDLLLLDIMLKGINGLDVCRILKEDSRTSDISIIMLTAKNSSSDIVKGFTYGADDYVTKPFDKEILLARIKAVLRRNKGTTLNKSSIIKVQDLVIDLDRYEARIENNPINLTALEFQALSFLASNSGRVYTRNKIIENIRGSEYFVNDRSIDILIMRLRRKLDPYSKFIETVYNIGYRFKDDQELRQ